MSTFCLISTLDVRGRSNNREHHVIRLMEPHFDKLVVVYRRRGAPGASIATQLSGQVTHETKGRIHYVAVDPPLNPPEGKLRNATTHAPKASPLRKALGRAVDVAAIARDRATITALTKAAREALCGHTDIQTQAMGPWAAAAAERLKARGIIEHYAYVDRDFEPGFVSSRPRKRWAARMERRAALGADLTIASSHRLAKRAEPFAQKRLIYSPTGVDLAAFRNIEDRKPEPHLIYVGEVTGWACLEQAVEAIALLNEDGLSAKLDIRGPALPAYEAHLRAYISASGLDGAVTWPGAVPREEALDAMRQASIGFCVFEPTPLRVHAMPLKLAEFMAMGLPSLATKDTEAGDVVTQGKAGFAIAPTSEAIASSIRAMAANPYLFQTQSRNARELAQSFDWALGNKLERARMRALGETDQSQGPAE